MVCKNTAPKHVYVILKEPSWIMECHLTIFDPLPYHIQSSHVISPDTYHITYLSVTSYGCMCCMTLVSNVQCWAQISSGGCKPRCLRPRVPRLENNWSTQSCDLAILKSSAKTNSSAASLSSWLEYSTYRNTTLGIQQVFFTLLECHYWQAYLVAENEANTNSTLRLRWTKFP